MNDRENEEIVVFASDLKWMSLKLRGDVVRRLSFGHDSAESAAHAIGPGQIAGGKLAPRQKRVVERLQRYAAGRAVVFHDIAVDWGEVSDFHASVLKACMEIPYGETMTYGALAQAAGRFGAARAVGTCMARNRVPLIIPCHRVVRAGGDIGPYSGAEGTATKRRLLEMEAAATGKFELVAG